MLGGSWFSVFRFQEVVGENFLSFDSTETRGSDVAGNETFFIFLAAGARRKLGREFSPQSCKGRGGEDRRTSNVERERSEEKMRRADCSSQGAPISESASP